jgi:hypothetical protein
MMEKIAQPGEGGGVHAHPISLHISTITYKVVVYAPVEVADMYNPPYISYSTPIQYILYIHSMVKKHFHALTV